MKKILCIGIASFAMCAVLAAQSPARTEKLVSGTSRVSDITYDSSGAVLSEKIYGKDGKPESILKYARENNRTISIEQTDLNGKVTGKLTYRYDRFGRCVGVDGGGSLSNASVGMLESYGQPKAAWTRDSALKLTQYDDLGREQKTTTLVNGATTEMQDTVYAGQQKVSTLLIDSVTGTRTETLFNQNNLPATVTVTNTNGFVSKTESTYDASGKIKQQLIYEKGNVIKHQYRYSLSGDLIWQEDQIDSRTTKTTEYNQNVKIESLFKDNSLIAKTTYRDGRVVRQEFYSGGALIRSRAYP